MHTTTADLGDPAAQSASPQRPSVWRETGIVLWSAARMVRAGGARLLGLILASQLIIVLVAFPVSSWVFREALRAGGMSGLDLGRPLGGQGLPLTFTLIALIVLFSFWLLALQFTALIVVLRWPGLSGRQFLHELGRVARRLLRPTALPLVAYLFLLVPLTGFGFLSALTRGVALPQFVSGELLKSGTGTAILTGFLLLLAWLNTRFALTVPAFVLTEGRRPLRTSWRLTRRVRVWLPLVLAVCAALVATTVLAALLAAVALAPTAAADALAPAAAAGTAAVSLGIAQTLGMILSGLAAATIAAIVVTQLTRAAQSLPAGAALLPDPRVLPPAGTVAPRQQSPAAAARSGRRAVWLATAAATVIAVGCSVTGWGTMHRLATAPDTLVLAHRGFSEGGVENTISGLEAAARAGADLVEMDVMQTRDGEFVAMHDATLGRLAGQDVAVKDLTLAELTKITVRDRNGNADKIPAFSDYVRAAAAAEMPLLIEIKLSGAETADHVDRLIDELEELEALEQNIYHSLDVASVDRLKQLRPDLTVGYTMAFAGAGMPDTVADFVVIEEWTATPAMQRAARDSGLGFMAWTVNDEPGYREHLRRGTDGIITDRPDLVLAARTQMTQGTGVTGVLVDALARFVTVL